jgi:hypothetical protein
MRKHLATGCGGYVNVVSIAFQVCALSKEISTRYPVTVVKSGPAGSAAFSTLCKAQAPVVQSITELAGVMALNGAQIGTPCAFLV